MGKSKSPTDISSNSENPKTTYYQYNLILKNLVTKKCQLNGMIYLKRQKLKD